MHSPQSKVNTAALFSSQPSAGSPQARARDHTPRPHTHIHTHIHTLPRPLRRSFHILEYTQTTQHQLGPLARNLAELSFCPACMYVCVCMGGGSRQAICVFVHVYFQDVEGVNTPRRSRIRIVANKDPSAPCRSHSKHMGLMKDMPSSCFRPVNLLSSSCHIHRPSISSDKRRAAATTRGKSCWSFLVNSGMSGRLRGPCGTEVFQKRSSSLRVLGQCMCSRVSVAFYASGLL